MNSPFRISVINDELGQDFGRACEVISREFGLEWIELRGMWNKNILKLDANEVAEARRILEKYKLREGSLLETELGSKSLLNWTTMSVTGAASTEPTAGLVAVTISCT